MGRKLYEAVFDLNIMRKIQVRELIEQKRKQNNMILGAILIGIMILSTVGYSFYHEEKDNSNTGANTISYNGFEFVKSQDYWLLQINDKTFYFQNLPNETQEIDIGMNKDIADFVNKPLYLSSQGAGAQEILLNLQGYVLRSQLACVEDEKCENNFPEKNCSNNFIIFQNKEFNKIVEEENCIYIIYKTEDEVKMGDAFVYRVLGVL